MDEVKYVKWGVIGVIALIVLLFFSPFVTISAGHRGVVTNFGEVQDKVLSEGFHFLTPIVQSVKEIEVRSLKSENTYSAYSKDTQTVDILLSVNYHLDPEQVSRLYQDVGMEYETKIIVTLVS